MAPGTLSPRQSGMKTYRTRNPRKSPVWQCVQRHHDTFVDRYPDAYEPKFGPLRPVLSEVFEKFRQCGILERGFARVRCDHCAHEYLLACSYKGRWFCPSCHQRKVLTTAAHLWTTSSSPSLTGRSF